ncbi:MFS general substrate transporter [Pleurostoma richardsiae]|uniref:MFS general substrate transporter n=1 Tax=Pleurostoma richardsiae TaxID=41990 RepID=A0AA38RQX8_9PEZI|nr:MFS general substrate transporter [Pleurostoma richardsiae]
MADTTDKAPQTGTLPAVGTLDRPLSGEQFGEKIDEKEAAAATDVEGVTDVTNGEIFDESEFTEEQYKKLTRKIDLYLIPLMFYCYSIQQTDKTSISTQALFNIREDTHMVGQDYQWLTTIFYLTYLVGEFPSNYLLQRFKMGRLLSIYMLCWAICVTCISAAQTWSQLMALRALQGFFECAISPGFLYITGLWYRTEEHANRALIWQASEYILSICTQLMMYGIAKHAASHGGLAAWRSISLFLGCATLAGAVACFFLLGTPSEVRWLSKEEKRMAMARVAKNKSGHDATGAKWSWPQVAEAFKDPQMWFSFLNAFLNNVPNGGFTTFSTLIYTSFGFNSWQTILYGLPRNGVGFLCFIGVSIYLRHFRNHRLWLMVLSCIISFIGLLALSLLPNDHAHEWIKWGLYLMTVVFAFAIFVAWTLIPSNVAGGTKKTVVSSMTFIGYCVGNMVGSQVFRTDDAPRYVKGTVACCIALGLETVLLVLWRLWYMYENRRRDRLAAESGLSKEEQERLGREMGEKDLTDWQNPYFRYSM